MTAVLFRVHITAQIVFRVTDLASRPPFVSTWLSACDIWSAQIVRLSLPADRLRRPVQVRDANSPCRLVAARSWSRRRARIAMRTMYRVAKVGPHLGNEVGVQLDLVVHGGFTFRT
jgi:hypothetical protein